MKRVCLWALLAAVAGASGCSLSRNDTAKQNVPATGTQTVQTQYPQTGAPSQVRPAGGMPQTGTTGTGSFLIPTPKPVKPGDCNH